MNQLLAEKCAGFTKSKSMTEEKSLFSCGEMATTGHHTTLTTA
jgi:hypothetical protein